MLKIDYCRMSIAIRDASETVGSSLDTGFLNRKTGKILFIPESEFQAADWEGKDVAVDSVFDRAQIENSPEDWVKIPKYDNRLEGSDIEEDGDGFIHRFLAEHGIEAELE